MSEQLCHANAVEVEGQAVLIRGKSGSGKSSLSLQLMSLGATLIADDQTHLSLRDGRVWARAPEPIAGLIEARGIGILTAENAEAPVGLVIDLDLVETQRFPKKQSVLLLGQAIVCLHKVDSPAWPAGIMQYLKSCRKDFE